MKLCDCKFFADENVDPAIVAWLRSEGYDAMSVVKMGLQGCSDVDVLRVATAEERVVISHDSDFGTLCVHQNRPVFGILFVRPGHIDPSFTIATLKSLLALDTELRAPFLIVATRKSDQVAIRVRLLYDDIT